MLAIGRALMAAPRVLLLDEPSLGLAPKIVDQIFEIIRNISASGTTILLVEQNAAMALELAHRGYVRETVRVLMTGKSGELRDDPAVHLGAFERTSVVQTTASSHIASSGMKRRSSQSYLGSPVREICTLGSAWGDEYKKLSSLGVGTAAKASENSEAPQRATASRLVSTILRV